MNISKTLRTTTLLGATLVTMALSGPAAQARAVRLDVAMGQPVLLAEQTQRAFLKIDLTGLEPADRVDRAPVNVALVLDKSGSMGGEKIRRAREAAIMALQRLGHKDIASVVAYDDSVEVLFPATRINERRAMERAIERIQAGGSTALFAGVSKGAAEVRKFLDREHVNRVVLLSDGLANVGPSSPSALGRLGRDLAKEGMSVTTIGLGLGYNEDLMTQLARNSGGNHAFAENGTDLARIFDSEFSDVLSVVAQDVEIHIHCGDGIRPLRVLGRDAEIYGQDVSLDLSQLYGNQTKYLVLEIEAPARPAGERMRVARVTARYDDMASKRKEDLSAEVEISFSASEKEVEERVDAAVMAPAVEQIAIEKSKKAVELRDQGRIEEARSVLQESAATLGQSAQRFASPALDELKSIQEQDAEGLADKDWNRQRKLMRKEQYKRETQQSY